MQGATSSVSKLDNASVPKPKSLSIERVPILISTGQPHNQIQRQQLALPQRQQNPQQNQRWQTSKDDDTKRGRTDRQYIVCHSCKKPHYANECPHRNLHCEGEPNQDEQYDEQIEMEQLVTKPQLETELPLEVTYTDGSPLLLLCRRLLVADCIEEVNVNLAPIFRTRVNGKGKSCNIIIWSASAPTS